MKKTQALRQLLESTGLSFLMESHNALCAKIVEEAGFEGIWASGLTLSASQGVRDSNELSWTQVLDILEFMCDATSIPILLDGDTGYGNFNNMRRLVKKLELYGIAGVCIEDKLFPKTNSFIRGETQQLTDVDEFCGKIKAGKDTQKDENFCIVARVEALIAGLGLAEALKRAEAYRAAGANAILIHSKKSDPGEILRFAREWSNRAPLVIVPTTYYSTPTEQFKKHNISTVIWANHLLRGAIAEMKRIAHDIHEEQCLVHVEDQIVPVREVFRLQGVSELLEAEGKYMKPTRMPNAVILAASRGEELRELTLTRPKAMISISGKSILQRMVDDMKQQGIREVTVVGGYRADTLDVANIDVITNPDYENSKDLSSLHCARERIGEDTLIVYGDLLARSYIIRDLMDKEAPLVAVVDSNISEKLEQDIPRDYVVCSHPDDRGIFNPEVKLLKVFSKGDEYDKKELHGQWIGLLKVKDEGRTWVRKSLDRLKGTADFGDLSVTDSLNDIIEQGHPVNVMYISGHWLDVNFLPDVERASEFI